LNIESNLIIQMQSDGNNRSQRPWQGNSLRPIAPIATPPFLGVTLHQNRSLIKYFWPKTVNGLHWAIST